MAYVIIPTRTTSDLNAAADVNQLMANDTYLNSSLVPITAFKGKVLNGLLLSNASDADHDITISSGSCVDSTGAYVLTLTSAMTKQLDAVWVVGTNAGGLFSGSVGNTTWYHVFLIRKDSDGTIDAGFDTSITAANKPVGYTAYRRVGSVLTNGSANIYNFIQNGNEFLWKSPILDIDVTTDTSATNRVLSVPLGVRVEALMNISWQNAAGGVSLGYFYSPDLTDLSASTTVAPLCSMVVYTNAILILHRFECWTDTSSQIRTKAEANAYLKIATLGWVDQL